MMLRFDTNRRATVRAIGAAMQALLSRRHAGRIVLEDKPIPDVRPLDALMRIAPCRFDRQQRAARPGLGDQDAQLLGGRGLEWPPG